MGTVIDQDWQAGRCCQSNKVAAGPLSPSVSQDPASVCPPPVFCEKIPVRESLSCSPPPSSTSTSTLHSLCERMWQ